MTEGNEHVPALLVWEPSDGDKSTTDDVSCDLSGHFWASAVRQDDGAWSYTIWDYQENVMLSGSAPTLAFAQEVVQAWDRVVVLSGEDPSRDWADAD